MLLILEGYHIEHEPIDITLTENQEQRKWMQAHSQVDENVKPGTNPLPPQIFHDDEYCGGYDGFHEAVEGNQLIEFLKLQGGEIPAALAATAAPSNTDQSASDKQAVSA